MLHLKTGQTYVNQPRIQRLRLDENTKAKAPRALPLLGA